MLIRGSARRLWAVLTAVLAGALLLVTGATPAAAAVTPMQWHRYNIYEPGAPSHERLICLTDGEWRVMRHRGSSPILS